MIPYEPEPLERLRARYPEALRGLYDPVVLTLGLSLRPGEQRRHVFDSIDGLRLIVSRDLIGGRPVLHLSASVCPETSIYRRMARVARRRGGLPALDLLRSEAEGRFRAISGDERDLTYLGPRTEKGVPHWVIEEDT